MKKEEAKQNTVKGITKNTNGDGYSVCYVINNKQYTDSFVSEELAIEASKQIEEEIQRPEKRTQSKDIKKIQYKDPMSWLKTLAEELHVVRLNPYDALARARLEAVTKSMRVIREFLDFAKIEAKLKELEHKTNIITKAKRENIIYIAPSGNPKQSTG